MRKGNVYIIQSLSTGYYYIGVSYSPEKRLQEHNSGKVIATKYRCPWKMCFVQEYPTMREAKRVEYRIKKLKRKDILERIIQEQVIRLK